MAPVIVLITGANRGIGKGLLELYLAKPNHTVIAANRDPNHPSSKALAELPKAEGTSLVVIKIDATVRTDPSDAVKALHSRGISHIDILIANAGLGLLWPKVLDVDTDDIQKHIVTNVYGFLWLFQAFHPLLKDASNPIWVTMGSSTAFLTYYNSSNSISRNMVPAPNSAYAPTKLMVHWYTKSIHIEEPWLTAFPIDPGFVQSDMGNRAAEYFGLGKATITIEESTAGIVKVIDAATRATHGGKMLAYDGKEVPW
ncbi:putative sterigmatocystin biosynthesis ketoreductase stcE [Daldinia childiae]|uniref:putative sterigmatocystin biosynthesis ketoreductase stcE n=1 Tax=Daldinia childiae TaxID=326645 RepID=UPI0014464821|nr:putative sterigmatocystin biosynthesis ketoreductase stcE [Daldinia childiae]KAF3061561.1 putative sterigmatocystin biosynthesis ketoreductase stcE [Daldinia childiae]